MSGAGKRRDVSDEGATLLEMLVVVAVMAISAALAFPNLLGAYDRLSADVARSAVMADLRQARSFALRSGHPADLQVFADGRRYRLEDRDVLLPAGVTLRAEPSRIVFSPTGDSSAAELSVTPRRGESRRFRVSAVGAQISAER